MVGAMKKHYELQPNGLAPYAEPLAFDWDEETGEVSGTSAEWIKSLAASGSTAAHPVPWGWTFSTAPLKSKTDMAAILGYTHQLPDDLAPFYPQPEDDGTPETSYTDADGVFVVGRDLLVY
jgi:hypothetical protein